MKMSNSLLQAFIMSFTPGPLSECWLWRGGVGPTGVGEVNYRGQTWTAQELSFWHHRYPPFEGMTIGQRCKNYLCVNPYHLEPRFPFRQTEEARNYLMVLKEEDVRKLRNMYEEGVKASTVAEHFCISESTVRDIVKRKTWKHV